MLFEEWKRLMDRKRQLDKVITNAMPSDLTGEEWDELYREYDEISEKLYDPSDQSRQEKNHADPLYGKG